MNNLEHCSLVNFLVKIPPRFEPGSTGEVDNGLYRPGVKLLCL